MPLAAGTRLGAYEIVAAIGAGGMGEVYRARDTRLGRDVAIKVLPESFARDREWLDRFHREARAVAALSHPNILAIYELGEAGGAPFAAMELLEGETLRERIAAGPQAVRRAAGLAAQIARGLAVAHEQGIVHRDVKPENIFVTRDGRVKILDFGIARQAEPAAGVTGTVTAAGTLLGTIGYMAPEQVRGLPADARSDIFAFGVVLYELLSGRSPFARASAPETMTAILKDEPPPLASAAGPISPPIERIVWRCLEKDPAARFQSCHDLAFALESATSEMPLSGARLESSNAATPRPARVRALTPLVLGVALGSILGAAAIWLWTRTSPPAPRADSSAAVTRRAALQIAGLGLALRPDGGALVYGTLPGSVVGTLRVRRFVALDSEPIEGTTGAQAPLFVSHDGSTVGFHRDGELFTVPLAGGPVTRLRGTAHLFDSRPSWTPDGRIVYTGPGGRLMIVKPDGSAPDALTTPNAGERHLSPYALSDGKSVLFTVAGADVNSARIAAVSLADGAVRTIVDGGAMTPQYADGYLLYARADGTLTAVSFDPATLQVRGAPQPLRDRAMRTRFSVAHFAAANGVLVYVPAFVSKLVEIHADGRREMLMNEERNWHHPRYSPDGSRIVMDFVSGGERDVWILDRRSKVLSRVTRIGDAHDPMWLPNGREVSFFSFRAAGGPLMIAGADGGSDPQPVRIGAGINPMELVNPGAWLRDGQAYVGGVASAGRPSDIWRIPRDGGAPAKLVGSAYDEMAIAVSPDGRWLAYQSDEPGRIEVYVRSINGRGPRVQVSSAGGSEPVWDRSGTVLYYVEPNGARRQLIEATLRTGPELSVASRRTVLGDMRHDEVDNHANYDVHPMERRFVVPERDVSTGVVAVFDWAASLRAAPQ